MAQGYDSGGNIAVDFVWGNTPLQGNTERGITEPVVKQTWGYQPDWDGKGAIFTVNLASATEVLPGWEITATAGQGASAVTRIFTVDSVSMGSPGYYVHTKEAYDAAFAAAGNVSPALFTTSIAPAVNYGGGAGDKGWSRTTRAKSDVLDPALDGHNIATEFWNNFPGYEPNVGFVPQQIWQGTITANYRVRLQDDIHENNNAFGYIITIENFDDITFSEEDDASLVAAINTKSFIGQRVAAWSFNDAYGNPWSIPAGNIVGADLGVDMYGNPAGTIQVQVDNYTPMFGAYGSIYPGIGTVLTLGNGAPKAVLLEAVIGTDFAALEGNFAPYGQAGYLTLSPNSWQFGTTQLSSKVTGLDLSALVGAYVGVSKVQEYGAYGYNLSNTKYNMQQITSAALNLDMYGNQKLDLVLSGNGYNYSNNFWDLNQGDSVAIIK